MIKIIREGNVKDKIFTKTCPDCGCEFEYGIEDLVSEFSLCLTSYPEKYRRYVICPCCGKRIYHDTAIIDNLPEPPKVWYGTTTNGDCSNCIYYQQMLSDPSKGNQMGDSLCTWCRKMKPMCNSSDNKVKVSYPGLDDNGEWVAKYYTPNCDVDYRDK